MKPPNSSATQKKKSQAQNSKKIKVFKKRSKRSGQTQDLEIEELKSKYETATIDNVKTFKDFPFSKKSLEGLKKNNYTKPTLIQLHTIIPALKGRDILGAAKTGSGKTLAFLLPVLEKLYINKWTSLDGLGALIISPTRELAYQTFETLKKIGSNHDFSAGLIIGGKNLHFETKRMDKCNIVICTPGRLLQHMDENPLFDCSNLQLLILDEADRCLDLGFSETMNSIIENLPKERQTLLFSATQTKSIKDLARLSLTDPLYISPHEQSEYCTPSQLKQNYIVCELENKLSFLYSFIRNHLKQKCIVFMSSCKQVRYVHDSFCKLRPGTSLLALYGTLHQERREQIYEDFCKKQNVVLFATDLAARGLDFPQVNWVVQLDCPENVETYIHRAGRTARYLNSGENLLVLLPSEEECMIDMLLKNKVPINRIQVDSKKLQSPQRKLESLLAEFNELKQSAQRAFVSYVKSVYLMKNKQVFDVRKLNTDAFANSLGLVVPPRIRFLQRILKNEDLQKATIKNDDFSLVVDENINKNIEIENVNSESSDGKINKVKTTKETLDFNIDSDSDEDIMKIKRKNHNLENNDELTYDDNREIQPEKESKSNQKIITKAAVAKKILKKKIIANQKIVFDEQGEVVRNDTKEKQTELAREYENEDLGLSGIDIGKAKEMLRKEDEFDKQKFREKLKARRREMKRKLKNKDSDGELDDFGSESDQSVDLSWLPDPDRIYGKRDGNCSSDENNENSFSDGNEEENASVDLSDNDSNEDMNLSENNCSEDSNLENYSASKNLKHKMSKNKSVSKNDDICNKSSDEEIEKNISTTIKSVELSSNKRKLVSNEKSALKKKQKMDIGEVTNKLSLNEAEELAMKLLFNK